MKKLLLLTYFILGLAIIKGQVPNNFKYQAVVRDVSGNLLSNKPISLQISILKGGDNGTSVYSEVFDKSTNEYGIIAVNIGGGETVQGVFANIDWGTDSYYLKVDVDIAGGSNYQYMGTSQILAVPYAIYALNVKNKDDADADPSNEFQTLSKNGNVVSLSPSGGSFTDAVDDADADPNNEIQDLKLIDNVLTITNNDNPTPINLSAYQGVNTDQQTLSTNIIGSTVELTIGGGTGGNTVSFQLPSDFVSRASGGTFSGPIYASNLSGINTGDMSPQDIVDAYQNQYPYYLLPDDRSNLNRLSLQGQFTLSGSSQVQFSSSGSTNLSLPTSGILATQDYVAQSINNSNALTTGSIWVGVGNVATPLNASTSGRILIGNGIGLGSYPITGDASMSETGYLTLANTTVVPGTYFKVTVDSKGRITGGESPTTLGGYNITDALSRNLSTGRILIGESGLATELDARGDGQILIGNGSTLTSRPIAGDITLTNLGNVTVTSINNNDIVLGGTFTTTNDNIILRADNAGSDVTLPVGGILANQDFVTSAISANNSTFTGNTNINTLGTITTGVWNAGSVTSSGAITGTSIIRSGGTSNQFLKADGSIDNNIYLTSTSGVSSVSGTTNQIVTSSNTGNVTLSLPNDITGLTSVTATSFVGSLTGNASTATALQSGHTISITGDLVYTSPAFNGTGNITAVGNLATVNANTGSFGSSSLIPAITVNGKGLITGVSTNEVVAPAGTLTGTTLANTVVTSSLTSVGTIISGVWNAGAVSSSGSVTGTSIIRTGGTSSQFLKADGSVDENIYLTSTSGVSSITGTTNQIVTSGSTGNITLSLPTVVTGLTSVTSTNFVGALTGNASTSTALQTGRTISITGDLSYTSPAFDGSGNITAAGTLAIVNGDVGDFGSASLIPTITVNAKGLITGVSTNDVVAPAGTLTGTTLANTVVTSSLTSVGTITSGVWNAGAVSSSGSITGASIIRTGGTSSQFLKADGSVDENSYLISVNEVADEFAAALSQTNFTLSSTPSVNSVVKMFVDGVRVSNTAYSVVGAAVTYSGPALSGGEVIQFDYYY